MVRRVIPRSLVALFLCGLLLTTFAFAQEIAPFSASQLVKLGDKVRYGSYTIHEIGEGSYQINDNEGHQADGVLGALGVDMYLICGQTKALMIDLGNNYIDGYAPDKLRPRKYAAEEFLAMVHGLVGKLPVEFAVTHMHPDHDGMTGALLNGHATLWVSDGEDAMGLQTQHRLDQSVYRRFAIGKQSFDLGGGRVVNTFLVRGHTGGGTVYILKKDGLIFTGDALGVGTGVGLSTGDKIKAFAEDSQKLVDYILANFSPYERYAIRVYTGHSAPAGNGPVRYANATPVDVGFLDWRFIQNMASCAKLVVNGRWLDEGSGLRFVESTNPNNGKNPSAQPGEKTGRMVYGIGSITVPLKAAYDAAGLKMPQ
jgi:glyoxylase-like metal-dependent hydrolase (beta-lactamase superfamily II)